MFPEKKPDPDHGLSQELKIVQPGSLRNYIQSQNIRYEWKNFIFMTNPCVTLIP